MRGLHDKRVLITGGASGIGAATAERFLGEGSRVCILDRDRAAREAITARLADLSGAYHADVSDPTQVQAAFDIAAETMGGVDVVINNAGISLRHSFLDITPEEWDRVLATNLTGHPVVVVPNGFKDSGSPTSISFLGNLFDEGSILAVAAAYQEATNFNKKRPGAFNRAD